MTRNRTRNSRVRCGEFSVCKLQTGQIGAIPTNIITKSAIIPSRTDKKEGKVENRASYVINAREGVVRFGLTVK